jgi:hypothetical protein
MFNQSSDYYRHWGSRIGHTYEASEVDIAFYERFLKVNKIPRAKFPLVAFERLIEAWEMDTNRCEAIPFERARAAAKSPQISEQ